MKRVMLVLGIALVWSTVAAATDIAISTYAGWFSQEAADREMQEIVDNVTDAAIEVFTVDQHDALADWVAAHTGDGQDDLLILCGQFPDTIYAGGNAQPDGSLAELFLDDGNTIINTGDYMFYVNTAGTNNADAGLVNMMDIGAYMWNEAVVVTTTAGQEFTPTLADYTTPRAWNLDQLTGDWHAELILAGAGSMAEPVIVRNAYTGGRLGTFYQTASQDDNPRGEVISEWINNWYLPIGSVDFVAMTPAPKSGSVIEPTTAVLEWKAGDDVVVHYVYFADSLDALSEADAAIAMEASLSTDAIPAYAGGLTPGQTYYWRVDEVGADGTVYTGDVWDFMVQPVKAWNPSPADGSINLMTDVTLSWAAGTGVLFHTLYIGESFDAVNDATDGGTQLSETVYAPELEEDKVYYWRVDEFSTAGGMPETIKGDVWTFSMVPMVEIGDPNLVGWWPLDEGAGTAAVDWSGYGNHGTLARSPEWVQGFLGGALQFEVGDYVDCGVGAAEGVTGDFTLAAWVKLAPGTDGNYGGIAGKLTHLATPEYRGFSLVRHSSNVFRLWVGDGTDDLAKSAVGSDELYTDTEWHHVAGMREGQTNTLYVDGILQTATTETGLSASPEFFHIGRQYSHLDDRYFLGLIDDVRVYDEALTADDLAALIAGDSLFLDRFDAYEAGSEVHGQGGWKGWFNDAGAGAPVSDANDPVGAGAVEILGSSDLVHEFDVAGGAVEFTAMQYIPSGTTGTTYFILMNTYNDENQGLDWSIQTNFNLETGEITAWSGLTEATSIIYDQWVQLKYVIDMDANTVVEYYNGIQIDSRAWDPEGEHNTLQAVDLYGNGASSVYYDDIMVK
ncbi:MAG: LamG domain-containing protein [Sedimentisphaerales bacterium]|nr:LamG domain-containing protein [Sedimentisphaerales bacterium]